jgi:hypothetical protein
MLLPGSHQQLLQAGQPLWVQQRSNSRHLQHLTHMHQVLGCCTGCILLLQLLQQRCWLLQ